MKSVEEFQRNVKQYPQPHPHEFGLKWDSNRRRITATPSHMDVLGATETYLLETFSMPLRVVARHLMALHGGGASLA
jgi:hypothetical protein